eukprot:4601583-Amphidinium_carterae.1
MSSLPSLALLPVIGMSRTVVNVSSFAYSMPPYPRCCSNSSIVVNKEQAEAAAWLTSNGAVRGVSQEAVVGA